MRDPAKFRRSQKPLAVRIVVTLVLAAAALMVFAGSALGAEVRPYTGVSFGPDGVAGSNSFERVQGITVDGSGNVYVFDGGAGKVYKFDSSGEPAEFSATSSNAISGVGGGFGGAEYEIAIAPAGSPAGTAGDIYVANNSGEANVYSSAGAKLGTLNGEGETCGVATDAAGNVYLGVFPAAIRKFVPTANPPKSTDVAGTGSGQSVCNVAADGAGRIYSARYSGGLFRLATLADKAPVEVDPTANTVAIQPGTNDVFANRGGSFAEYEPDGTLVGVSGTGELSESHGIGVNTAATKVYAGTSTKVKVFGATKLVPDVTTGAADAITATAATLHGTIGAAGGPPAACEFQYVTQEEFSNEGFSKPTTAACDPAGPFSGTATESVKAEVGGLVAGATYRVRLVGTNTNGSNSTVPQEFTTSQAVNVASTAATEVTGVSFRANGEVTPESHAIEQCVFEWGTGYEFQNSLPCAESSGEIGTGNAPVALHSDVSGLEPVTRYQYRIKVKNSIGTTISNVTEVFTHGAIIFGTPQVDPHSTSAVFTASINPNNDPTVYVFEYVTKAEFEVSGFANAIEVPEGGDIAGSGEGEIAVSAEATGLQPDTEYVFRLVLDNVAKGATSEEVFFKTFGPATSGLPDGRAWEQVTPVTPYEKNGNNMGLSDLNVAYASPDGSATTYYATTGAGNTESSIQYPIYIARRGADSWSSNGFNLPANTGNFVLTMGYTEDLSGGYANASTPGVTSGLYLHEFANNRVYPIIHNLGNGEERTFPAAETPDGEYVLVESNVKETSDAIEGDTNVYLWKKSTGELKLVSVMPGGGAAGDAWPGPWDYWNEVPTSGGSRAAYYTKSIGTLSRDASKAFFTAKSDYQIYLRSNPFSAAAATTPVSSSQKTNGSGPGGTDPNGVKPADFIEATPSGSFVFFASSSELTNDANTGGEDEGTDLYRYDTASGNLIDVAPVSEGTGTRFLGFIGSGADGRSAYFVARSVLAAGGEEGEQNIYQWREGQPIRFIGKLAQGAEPDEVNYVPTRYTFNFRQQKSSRVTADGRTLVFSSSREQAGFPNPTGRWRIYRWEEGGALQCISCNPTGNQTRYDANFVQAPSPFIRPDMQVSINTRNLSSDGKRLFFSTPEGLVGNDLNGVGDVYEWEAKGKGSCDSEAQNGGCLFLISTGTSTEPSYFSDASESGNDVFIFTTQKLVGQDKDDLYDVYDARVGGGIAAQNPMPPAPCEGEACLGAGTAPTAQQGRGTSTFAGPGNTKPKKQKKKKKHHHKKHKHHGKSHHKRHGKKSQRNAGGKR